MKLIPKIPDLARAVDSLIAVLSPEAGLRREHKRSQLSAARLYDAATKGRRGDGFRKISSDGPQEGLKGLSTLRQRSRDFSRNNGYALKAVNAIASNTIGTGIVLQIKSKRKNSKDQKAKAWKDWAESTACDYEGLLTFAGVQEIAMKMVAESGECIIRKRVRDSAYYNATKKIPLQLHIMEPEFLADSSDRLPLGASTNRVVGGIEFNADGLRVAYHFYKTYPGTIGSTETVRVPAEEVIHLYRLDRAGQLRGVPWGAAVLLNLSDLDGYEDAELVRRKVASCYAAFITESEPDDTIGQEDEFSLIDKLQPGLIEILPPGKSVTFGNPPSVQGYSEYATSVLHKISAGYQVPYSVLTGDFSQVNFSSGRMGWLEFQRLIEQWRWNMLIPRMLDPIWFWFDELCSVLGLSEEVNTSWTAPRREMIDPLKEVQALSEAVKNGFQSLPEAIREVGYDPDQILEETKEYNAKLDAAKIILDSDPRNDPKRLSAKKVATESQTV